MSKEFLCPIMLRKGYPEDESKCDYPQTRTYFFYLSREFECAEGDNCKLRELIPEEFSAEVDKMEYDGKKVIVKCMGTCE